MIFTLQWAQTAAAVARSVLPISRRDSATGACGGVNRGTFRLHK
jgi:hypothetical protein